MIIEVIKKGRKEKYRFVLKGDNGEIIAQSEKYHNKRDCLDTVAVIRNQAQDAFVRYVPAKDFPESGA